ncbi:cation:proton antiporter [Hutsoniella sourekii]|uniref:cation:proton antiporter n=1 Tax=Hutsoniella sourekii TaxID=87650 RepID=UPI00047FA437|nr:cation:proton antiporter [Hutsoniella sourekii]
MLLSVAGVIIVGSLMGAIFNCLKLPRLLGYLLAGILLGPSMLDSLDPGFLQLSPIIRRVALIIILVRAGLTLNMRQLTQVGRPALLLCFVPASMEMLGALLVGPWLLGLSLAESLLIGSVLAAVSPAVVVPRMVNLIEDGYGVNKQIPQMILAGASADDVYVLVLFTAFMSLNLSGHFQALDLLKVPVAILSGILIGWLIGFFLVKFLQRYSIDRMMQILLILAISFILVTLEDYCQGYYSGLLSIISMNMMIFREMPEDASSLSRGFNHLWRGAEIFLFFLVGASVDLSYTLKSSWLPLVFIACLLVFRVVGVALALVHTALSKQERLFVAFAYLPKATVQAAIGSLPLASGLASGELILSVSVLSILTTAPLGAILTDYFAGKWLTRSN